MTTRILLVIASVEETNFYGIDATDEETRFLRSIAGASTEDTISSTRNKALQLICDFVQEDEHRCQPDGSPLSGDGKWVGCLLDHVNTMIGPWDEVVYVVNVL